MANKDNATLTNSITRLTSDFASYRSNAVRRLALSLRFSQALALTLCARPVSRLPTAIASPGRQPRASDGPGRPDDVAGVARPAHDVPGAALEPPDRLADRDRDPPDAARRAEVGVQAGDRVTAAAGAVGRAPGRGRPQAARGGRARVGGGPRPPQGGRHPDRRGAPRVGGPASRARGQGRRAPRHGRPPRRVGHHGRRRRAPGRQRGRPGRDAHVALGRARRVAHAQARHGHLGAVRRERPDQDGAQQAAGGDAPARGLAAGAHA